MKAVAGLGAMLLLAGCAALRTPAAEPLAPLERALLDSPEALEAAAAGGEAEAQYALSVALRHGLHGRKRDSSAADAWRARALAQRRTTPVTQYVPAFGGTPSRVHIINLSQAVLPPGRAMVMDACASALAGASFDAAPCGSPGAQARLRALWAAAWR